MENLKRVEEIVTPKKGNKKVKEKVELKTEWDNKSKAYNSIFDYLEKKGLKENDLIDFSKLLIAYTSLI